MTNLPEIAMAWMGTPFFPGAAKRGVGVDCVHLVAEILREAGHLDHYRFPPYSMDGGHHLQESLIQQWLEDRPDFERLAPFETIRAGDVLCFRIGGVAHHVGIAVGQHRFIHAARGRGVRLSTLRDATYARRLVAVYRPTP